MGFPTRACMELTSDDAMKQSLRLVKDVSLSMSWNAESLPVNGMREKDVRFRWPRSHSRDHATAPAPAPHSDCKILVILCQRFTAAMGNYNY